MVSIDLEQEELDSVISMMEGSTIQMAFAEKGLKLLKKLQDAKKT